MPTCMSFNESLIEETRLYYAKTFSLRRSKKESAIKHSEFCAQLEKCALNDKLEGNSSRK
ncbi:Uncharacterized protein BM_BM17591 [Brugia malayi]|uniref:Uncharacterized protein n=1 Tax=Brugia malayi TaxID=6279 RepID=A0A4E9FEA2_BRUMA|nr:Uncharacterized protein BM_BM17591 [Brugia malayi]VIO95127.1 Uncharacterized protein BM_BM17591 [Brugia malayi]